jgi:3-hydroxyisobutyrate dehydrogenase-like beta-hydroxyacid dehydrogenase
MKIKYNGPSPLRYHSAPSGTDYMFNPGEEIKILKEDTTFFTNMTKAAGSSFELCGTVKRGFELCGTVKKAVEEVKAAVKPKPKPKGGNK